MANSALTKNIIANLTDFTAPMTITGSGTNNSLAIDNSANTGGNSLNITGHAGSGTAVSIDNNGTANALSIDNSASSNRAISITNASTKRAVYINQNANGDGFGEAGLFVYSNVAQTSSPLVYVRQDNTGSSLPNIWLQNDDAATQGVYIIQANSSSTGAACEIDNDATGHSLYIHADGALASGKYNLYVNTDSTTLNAGAGNAFFRRNHTAGSAPNVYIYDNSTNDALRLTKAAGGNGPACSLLNQGTGHGLFITQSGEQASQKYALYVNSDGQQTNAPLVYFRSNNTDSTQNVLNVRQDHTGASGMALTVVQDGTGRCAYFSTGGANGLGVEVANAGNNHGVFINQTGQLASGKYALYVDSNDDAHATSSVVYFRQNDAGATAGCVQIYDNGDAYGLKIQQGGGSGDAVVIDNSSATGDVISAYGNSAYLPYPWMKIGQFDRDLTAATGTQAVTGVGFKPRQILFFAAKGASNANSMGMSDGSTDQCVAQVDSTDVCNARTTECIEWNDGSNNQKGSVQSLDADGFTISWVKSGTTPAGTIVTFYLAIG